MTLSTNVKERSEPELTQVNKCVIDQDASMMHSNVIQTIVLYKKNPFFYKYQLVIFTSRFKSV